MKLTKSQMEGITKGAFKLTQTEGQVSFHRFTKKQMEAFAGFGESRRIRAAAPSGVCLDFVTDASELALGYAVLNTARNWFCFDIFVDGALAARLGENPLQTRRGGTLRYRFEQGGEKRVTVYLPHLCEIALEPLDLSGAEVFYPAPKEEKRLCCFGDSITQGMESYAPSDCFAVRYAREMGYELFNLGVGGGVYDPASLDEGQNLTPDSILVAFGTNDWVSWDSFEVFEEKVREYYRVLDRLYPGVPTTVITPVWRADWEEDKGICPFPVIGETIRKYAGNKTILDGFRVLPHSPDFLADKLIHPNEEGFKLYTQKLIEEAGKPL